MEKEQDPALQSADDTTRVQTRGMQPSAEDSAGIATGEDARDPVRFGIGVFTAFVAAAFGLAAVIFVWFGVFPGLVMALICVPLSLFSANLIRKGRPHHTA